jgi:hypothetical protein
MLREVHNVKVLRLQSAPSTVEEKTMDVVSPDVYVELPDSDPIRFKDFVAYHRSPIPLRTSTGRRAAFSLLFGRQLADAVLTEGELPIRISHRQRGAQNPTSHQTRERTHALRAAGSRLRDIGGI